MLFQRDDGLERLSSCFYWTEFDGDDKRQYLHQEFVYENVMLAITRGLPWSTVAQVANITKDILPKLKGGSFHNVPFGPLCYAFDDRKILVYHVITGTPVPVYL